MVSCIFIGTLLVAAENPLLRCFVLVFYPWHLLLHGRVRPVKITLSGSTSECVGRRPFDWGKNDFGHYLWCMFADISDQSVETEWYLVL